MRLPTRYTILLASVLVVGWASARGAVAVKEGDVAPQFSVTTDQGRHLTSTEYGARMLVLNFWHTSCVPCVKELPSLSDFARVFRSEGVTVLAVSGDEDDGKYRRFLHDHRVLLQTYRDPSLRISRSFGTFMFPETYIIQRGRIVRKVIGGIDWTSDDMRSFIRSRLDQR